MAREDFESSPYDINQIYDEGATDNQGHSVNLRVKVPTEWAGAIGALASSPDWPEYSTPQDFLRDAIYHRKEWATRQKDRTDIPEVRNLISIERMLSTMRRYDNLNRRFASMREQMIESFREAAINDTAILAAIIEEMSDTVDEFPEPFRTKLRDDLDYWKRRV